MIKKNLPKKSFSELQKEWQHVKDLPLRDRIRMMRTLGHDIKTSYNKQEGNLDELSFYVKVMQAITKHHASYSRFLNTLIADWLKLSGQDEVEILAKVSGKIAVNSATLAISDHAFAKEIIASFEPYIEKNVLSDIVNCGKGFIFGTGGDREFNVQLRLVNATLPVLSAKEYKFAREASEIATLAFPTGEVVLADPHDIDHSQNQLSLSIPKGHYKVCTYIFSIPKKVESFYLVLCATNDVAKNELIKLPELV